MLLLFFRRVFVLVRLGSRFQWLPASIGPHSRGGPVETCKISAGIFGSISSQSGPPSRGDSLEAVSFFPRSAHKAVSFIITTIIAIITIFFERLLTRCCSEPIFNAPLGVYGGFIAF